MNKPNKFSPEVRERGVRLVQEHRDEYSSLWAAAGQRGRVLQRHISSAVCDTHSSGRCVYLLKRPSECRDRVRWSGVLAFRRWLRSSGVVLLR
jgi:hypothetical protein